MLFTCNHDVTASVCRDTSELRVSLALPAISSIPRAFPQVVPPFVSCFLSPGTLERQEPRHMVSIS